MVLKHARMLVCLALAGFVSIHLNNALSIPLLNPELHRDTNGRCCRGTGEHACVLRRARSISFTFSPYVLLSSLNLFPPSAPAPFSLTPTTVKPSKCRRCRRSSARRAQLRASRRLVSRAAVLRPSFGRAKPVTQQRGRARRASVVWNGGAGRAGDSGIKETE